MQTDAETHRQAFGESRETCGRVGDKTEPAEQDKNTTRRPTERTKLVSWRFTETESLSKEYEEPVHKKE